MDYSYLNQAANFDPGAMQTAASAMADSMTGANSFYGDLSSCTSASALSAAGSLAAASASPMMNPNQYGRLDNLYILHPCCLANTKLLIPFHPQFHLKGLFIPIGIIARLQ